VTETHKRRWRRAYDAQAHPTQLAGGLREYNGYRSALTYRLLQASLRRATAHWGAGRLLDVGCGAGDTGSLLGGRQKALGLDFSAAMLAQARLHYADVAQGDAEALPLADKIFDYVLAVGLWQCLPAPRPFLQECVRVLRPQGEAAFVWVLHADFLLYRRGVHFRLDPEVALSLTTPAQMQAELEAVGLRPLRFYAALPPVGVWGGVFPVGALVPAYSVLCRKTGGA